MLWHGESHSTIFWSVKVSSLGFTPLTFVKKTLLSQFSILSFHPRNSLAARRRISSWIALGLLRRIMDIFFLQVRPIHSEIYLRRMTLAEIRGPNLSCQCRNGDSSSLLFIYQVGIADGFSPITYLWSSFENDWKRGISMSFLSLLWWNEFSWSATLQPVVSYVEINSPPDDTFLSCIPVASFVFEATQWHKSVHSRKKK